ESRTVTAVRWAAVSPMLQWPTARRPGSVTERRSWERRGTVSRRAVTARPRGEAVTVVNDGPFPLAAPIGGWPIVRSPLIKIKPRNGASGVFTCRPWTRPGRGPSPALASGVARARVQVPGDEVVHGEGEAEGGLGARAA